MHVVVVDDEPRMVELIATYLARHGIRTTEALDGATALTVARRLDVDAVVLDLMLPEIDGLEVCRRLRAEGNDVPILILTARGAVPERVTGLQSGADDYLVKPFALEELHARLTAIWRRRVPDDTVVSIGDVRLDRDQRRLWVADREVHLARREYDLLDALMLDPGRVVTRDQLFEAVWNDDVDIRSNVIDVYMSRLRSALSGSSDVVITTLRGTGYRLQVVGAAYAPEEASQSQGPRSGASGPWVTSVPRDGESGSP